MKASKLIILSLFSLIMISATIESKFVGQYGVDGHELIVLEVLSNNTYLFKDHSNPNKKIMETGNWSVKNNTLILESKNAKSFHSKWKLDKKGMRIKSRYKTCFYTLGRR